MQQDSKIILKALGEIRRGQILATKANPQTEGLYSNSFVYAIMHSVCPIFDEEVGSAKSAEERLSLFPFYESYDLPHDLVEEIYKLIDRKWFKKEKITFDEIERQYKVGNQHWPGKEVCGDLMDICRYFYLRGVFDDKEFWEAFMSDRPSEASRVTNEWNREELVKWA